MRVSTGQIYESQAANYQRNYAKFLKTGEEVSSEIKLNTASDDPVGAARVLQLAQQNSMLEQYAANISTINNNSANSETALNSIVDALGRARELALAAGNGAQTDADRVAVASELKQLQSHILGLMNSQDANGQYLFSGTDSAQPPYSMNADGTYSYHGNQTAVNLPVGEGLVLPSNVTGWQAFDQAGNSTRTSMTQTSGPNDSKVHFSGGAVSSGAAYNSSFLDGQPYKVSFVSDPAGPKLLITDATGADVTADASTGGAFGFSNAQNQNITFRGVDLSLNINLSPAEAASAATANAALVPTPPAERSFTLEATPASVSTTRSPGNSAATVTSSAVGSSAADREAFNNTFPAGGAILKFTASGYELYAQPLSNNNPAIASGSSFGPTITAAGVVFEFSTTPAPQPGDQFVIDTSTHQSKNVLNTLSDLISALSTPIDGNQLATQQFGAALTSGLNNLANGIEQASTARSTIGAQQEAAIAQNTTNELIRGNNVVESQSYTKSDAFEAASRLTLEKTMLDASQQVFLQLSRLNLFSQL